jgi:hypothetical protein
VKLYFSKKMVIRIVLVGYLLNEKKPVNLDKMRWNENLVLSTTKELV